MKKNPLPDKCAGLHGLLAIFIVLCAGCARPAAAPPADPPRPAGEEETVSITAAPAEPPAGPWLMIPGPDGILAYDLASGTAARVEDRHLLAPQDVTAIAAPEGGLAAYITGENGIDNLTLNILRMPRALAQTIPLVSPEFAPPAGAQPGDPAAEALRALFESTSIAWSPDGQALAFTGLLEGPSADLYVLPIENLEMPPGPGRVLRLTDGPSQAVQPFWSPDGRYTVHAGVENFGTGAGYTLAGVWAARADGSGAHLLYEPVESGGESFVGWLDASTLIVHSWRAVCGNEGLRTVDIRTGAQEAIWEGPFNGVAFDPDTERLLISIDHFTSQCPGAAPQGLYLLKQGEGPGLRLLQAEVFLPTWDAGIKLFFARTPEAVYAVGLGGSVLQLQAPEPLLPSASSKGALAWASPISGIWLAQPDGAARQVAVQPASSPAWSPDGNTLFFLAENGLFRAEAPNFEPELLVEGLLGGGVFWLAP